MDRIAGSLPAVRVKRYDMSHNADPARLALLDDESIRVRLAAKYRRLAARLDEFESKF